MPWSSRHLMGTLCLVLLPALTCIAASADEMRTYRKVAGYDDVLFELNNAILERGLTIHSHGEIASMLERTGPAVGSSKPIYAKADFINFCSAKLSRQLMDAEATNLGYCPFGVFIYAAAALPGTVVVGYRRPTIAGSEAGQAALRDLDALLDGIVRAALQ